MPKNIHTPRDELICGKLDAARRIAEDHNDVMLAEIIDAIRHDAERMEAKLVSRRDEALTRAVSPPVPDDVADSIAAIEKLLSMRYFYAEDAIHMRKLLRAASTPSAEVRALRELVQPARQLSLMAQTACGTSGTDQGLIKSINMVQNILEKLNKPHTEGN